MPHTIAPYGTWRSPISAELVASDGIRLGFVRADGEDLYWVEGRPQEGGRSVLVRCTSDGRTVDVTPPDVSVRTRLHEYGGVAYTVSEGTVYYVDFADQRMYRVHGQAVPEPLTPAGERRYADFIVDAAHRRLIAVCEDHTNGGEPVTTLVAIPVGGVASGVHVLDSGHDFYGSPALTPDGSQLAWIAWRHPNMPWDGTELWVADLDARGALTNRQQIAGGAREAILQPGWSRDGALYFISDRSGWGQLHRADRSAPSAAWRVSAVLREPIADAEFGRPLWQLGSIFWAFAGPSRIVAPFTRRGRWSLTVIDTGRGTWTEVASGFEPTEWMAATDTDVIFVGATATMAPAVVRVDLEGGSAAVLRRSSSEHLADELVSRAEPIEFPTGAGSTAHAFYYPPRHANVTGPHDETPPLLVISHGGPTAAARATFDLHVQFWTSRGFALVDVNYRGSAGFGRAYREQLNGQWGVADVEDAINAARFLADTGRADPRRLIIRGSSAGGYSTLAALTFHPNVFTAGASYYGICDLEVLARDTHKFESRYLETLIGPYPARRDIYRTRSPIHFVARLACPLILFQGVEDRVVPPNQAEMMANAVRSKGVPVALLMFDGEQHGFRRAESIVRSLNAELYFYGAVFGFTPADRLEPIAIDNLPRAT